MRTSFTFSVLQAIAATSAIAIIMWSLGLPSLRIADAASVTDFSDTLSDSEPSVVANHTIEFVATNGVAASETIVVTFDSENDAFDLTGIGEEDVDLLEGGVAESVGTNWLVTVNAGTPDTITLTSQGAGGVIAAGATTTILVGLHATNDGSPDTQIVNPASVGSYDIGVTSGSQDAGETRVAIVDTVTVTASVDTQFTFTVSGVAAGVDVNGTDTTGGDTTTTTIPFGELDAGTASTAAQQLAVSTNAANGFAVTMEVDGQLTSGGADIDGFKDGAFTTTPEAWAVPTGDIASEDTWGHWGISTDDASLTAFGGGVNFASASTTPVEIFSYDAPINGENDTEKGQGTTTVIYKTEITSLQEAGENYTANVTYVATPVF